MVFYRKYRPQKISELDLPYVREKLTDILSSKSLPHAFLFTGSKGLGKTSAARILAKAINCESRNKDSGIKNEGGKSKTPNSMIEPCNACMACVSITNGSNIDVLEIDAASNGGVEEIRNLRERVKFASSMLRYKVYIIDEVHMLSTGAFNALLKTLEEPPSHVIFVLATTELWKLPSTVVSRTFQIQFEKPTVDQMKQSLERIVKGEDIKIDDEVLESICVMSDGAFRDAAKNLEELALASKGKNITSSLFEEVFRTEGLEEEVDQLLISFENRNAKKGLETIARLSSNGVDFKTVIERLVDHLRGLLMLRNSIESTQKDLPGLTIANIQELLALANEAYAEHKMSVIPQLPLELMVVKYCILDREVGGETGIRNKELGIRNQGLGSGNQELGIRAESPVIGIRQLAEKQSEIPQPEKLNASAQHQASLKPFPQLNPSSSLLKDLISEVNKVNKPAAALLRSAKEAVIRENELVILTPFPVHADRLKSERVLPDILKGAEVVTGKKISVAIKTSS